MTRDEFREQLKHLNKLSCRESKLDLFNRLYETLLDAAIVSPYQTEWALALKIFQVKQGLYYCAMLERQQRRANEN
jgi:hypothetical protein